MRGNYLIGHNPDSFVGLTPLRYAPERLGRRLVEPKATVRPHRRRRLNQAESGDRGIGMVRRALLRLVPVILLVMVVTPAQAFEILDGLAGSSARVQEVLGGMAVDTSVRLEYLFGVQIIRDASPEMETGGNRFRFDFDQRTPFASGTAEVTPAPWFSCRAVGGLSFLEPARNIHRSTELDLPTASQVAGLMVKPRARMWEAAGLYHLHNAGGYRFSITGGFRELGWRYNGEQDEASLHEVFVSRIPFMGMQTAMFLPWCKARFEVLGSPFVRKSLASNVRLPGSSADFNGVVGKGGFVEFQMEGSVRISPNVQAGLFGRYLFEDLRGVLNGSVNGLAYREYDASSNDSIAIVGVEASLVF
jgi:hypothetical protein